MVCGMAVSGPAALLESGSGAVKCADKKGGAVQPDRTARCRRKWGRDAYMAAYTATTATMSNAPPVHSTVERVDSEGAFSIDMAIS
ncbi:MAG: hypothetical protein BroJett024_33700 [Alphaproteobacteria bacterium]|nr:MAG: hypothetical protein BroJett024_33700 [Alphaproteobacteria bacterium]